MIALLTTLLVATAICATAILRPLFESRWGNPWLVISSVVVTPLALAGCVVTADGPPGFGTSSALIVACAAILITARGLRQFAERTALYEQRAEGLARQLEMATESASSRVASSESRFHELVRATPVGVFETDGDGLLTYVSGRFCEITKRNADELIGRKYYTPSKFGNEKLINERLLWWAKKKREHQAQNTEGNKKGTAPED